MRFLISVICNAFALWVAVFLLNGMNVVSTNAGELPGGGQQVLIFLVGGLILALINMIVRPIVATLSLPLYIITLGLFFIVVNALMLMLTSWVSNQVGIGVTVDGFWWAVAGGIVVGVVNWILGLLVPNER